MSGAGQTALTLGFNVNAWRDTAPLHRGRPQQLLPAPSAGAASSGRSHRRTIEGTYEEEGDGVSKDCQFSRNALAATAAGGRLQ